MRQQHGLRHHQLYSVWTNMKTRCSNKNTHNYSRYGGRGITICDEWKSDFKCFYDFCIKNGWEPHLQVDRIDNNKGYCPGNCRFVGNRENSINRLKIRKDNKTGFVGVYEKKGRGKYSASINVNQKLHHIGNFDSPIDAAKARDAYVIENGLGYNMNFPSRVS